LLQTKAALRDAMHWHFPIIKTERNLMAETLFNPRFKDIYFSFHEKDAAKGVTLTFLHHQHNQIATEMPTGKTGVHSIVLMLSCLHQLHCQDVTVRGLRQL